MKKLITITHLLFSIFTGIFLGGLIFNNSVALKVGLILLVLDIIIGIILQYSINKKYKFEKYSKEESIDEKTERCKKMFNKANDILYSEYNDFLFGIDLNGNKRPLSSKHNELVRKVLDSEIDIATASYLSIDDIIVSPWQYLKKSIQNEIVSKYGSLTPYSAFVFLNDYFYENYNYILVIYKNQTTYFAELKKYRFSIH